MSVARIYLPQGGGNGLKSVVARNPEGESESRL